MNYNDLAARLDQIQETQRQQSRSLRIQSLAIAFLVVLALLFVTREVSSQDFPTPSQALDWALADQLQLSESDRRWQRYLWIPPWLKTDEAAAVSSFGMNTAASQASIIIQPRVIANGWMLAVDLRRYAPRLEQLTHLVSVWDGLATTEPYFHVFQEFDSKVVAVLAPHVAQDHAVMLAELNVSPALVYRLDWFLSRMLDQSYYDFMGFGSEATFTSVLSTVGVDEKLSRQIGGDQRIALFRRDLNGKPGRIDRIQGAAGRFNTGAVWITRDLFDETVAIDKHPIYNLLQFAEDGGEVIFERQNGLHGFFLMNSQGKLVREAPPNLVNDHTVPAPHNRRLRPSISCLRCHGSDEGLKPVNNDVRTLLAAGAIDVVDDFGDVTKSREENIDRLAGLYAGDFTRRIQLGRDDYSLAVRVATQQPTRPEGWTVPEISTLVSSIYGGYVYDAVGAATACRELGYDPGDNPLATIRRVLPTLPPDPEIGITFEDPVAAALRVGIPVRRVDFERIYATARLLTQERERTNVENN